MDAEWRKPYTLLENLQGASTGLAATVQKLRTSANALNAAVQDYDRVRKASQFRMHSEILSQDDIRFAEAEVISKRLPEIESLLSRAQTGLKALEKEVKAVEYKVDEQAEQIKSLESSLAIQQQPAAAPRPHKKQKTDHIQQLQRKKQALEQDLAAIEKELDENRRKADQMRAEQATAAEEKVAVTASVDHAPPQPNDQTMTTEDIHTLKQIKALSKLLLPAETSAMVTQLLERHCGE
ncbi:hypothetical protein BJV82DRAFT_4752 [Fennellomyces sp. T-0311]|nr:hypothetical protein BJV82DRAFT_4752 [Fennellomyces sp. T-0311]